MTEAERKQLMSMAHVALTQVPQHVRADFAKKPTAYRNPAADRIAEILITYIEQGFVIEPKQIERQVGYGRSGWQEPSDSTPRDSLPK